MRARILAAFCPLFLCAGAHAAMRTAPVITPVTPVAPLMGMAGAAASSVQLTPSLAQPSVSLVLPRSLVKPHNPSVAPLTPRMAQPAIAPVPVVDGPAMSAAARKGKRRSRRKARQQARREEARRIEERLNSGPTVKETLENAEEGISELDSGESVARLTSVYDGGDAKGDAAAVEVGDVGSYQAAPSGLRTSVAGSQHAGRSRAADTEYLRETEGLDGEALKDALHRITGKGYRPHGYDDARDYMFSTADNVEHFGVRGVRAGYSGTFVPGKGTSGSKYRERGDENRDGHVDRHGMNAEHLWPQSYFKKRAPMRADLHHLMPTFAHPNSERSRYPFGEVSGEHPEYRNNEGAMLEDGVFEPPDFSKGRVARGLLYFFIRYHNRNILPPRVVNKFWNSRINTLLRWNRDFPPSDDEIRRNDLVEEFQGNRNPFVDDPGLADRIGAQNLKLKGGGRGYSARAHAEENGHYKNSKPNRRKSGKNKSARRRGGQGGQGGGGSSYAGQRRQEGQERQ